MDVPYQLFQALAAQGYRAKAEDTSIIQELLINHSAEPFNDMKVRQAASFGIDRQAISDAVTLGMGKPASSLMAPVLDYFNTDLPVPVRDVAKAKALLAEAGKPSVTFELMIAAGIVADERAAVLIQSQLAEVGFTVNISKVNSTQEWNSLVDGKYQATLNWWYNETRDPDNALRWAIWGKGDNKSYYTRYNNEKVNDLLEQGAGTPEGDARKAIYFEAQKIAYDEVAQIGLYYPPYHHAYSSKVEGATLNPGYQFSTIDEAKLDRRAMAAAGRCDPAGPPAARRSLMDRYAFVLRRPLQLVLVLFGISLVTFVLAQLTPGDPVRIMLGPRATLEAIATVRARYGLDKPLLVQYGYYMMNLLRADFGQSLAFRTSVLNVILERAGADALPPGLWAGALDPPDPRPGDCGGAATGGAGPIRPCESSASASSACPPSGSG